MDLYSMQVHKSRFWDGPLSCQARPFPGQMSLLQPVLQQFSHPRRTYARGTPGTDAGPMPDMLDLAAGCHLANASLPMAWGSV